MEAADNKGFIYEFGRFVLDPGEKTLFADGQPVHLPAKEFDTLVMLVEHNGRALSKEEMLAAVWQDAFVEETNLAKQISRLRKILNANGEEFIETIPKHGYRFIADLHRTAAADRHKVILKKRTVSRLTVALDDEIDPADKPQLSAGNRWVTTPRVLLTALAAAAAVVTTIVWYQWPKPASTKIDTIAVLPLRSLNADKETNVLGLGLTDALITKLASLRRVVVRPTTAVVALPAETDPIDAARRLHVDAVLDGTIQQADGRLRVTARLFRTASGEQIWTDKFDQPSAGLFALQDALSASIAKTLSFELSKSDSDLLLHRGTENADAYEKYLQGRFYQSQNTADGFDRSLGFYRQAIALDPEFAEAYAGVADANVLKFNFGFSRAADVMPDARAAANRALQLNPDLPDAHNSLAMIQFLSDRDWDAAEKSLERTIELNPNNADAYHRYGYILTRLGRFDEALTKYEKAGELNPLSSITQANIGLTYLCARRYPQAIEQLEKVAAENPRFSFPLWLLGTTYEAAGDVDKAFEVYLKALEADNELHLANRLRKVKNSEGLDAANRLWLDESEKAVVKFTPPIEIAMRAASVKDREKTLYWLEKALNEGDTTIGNIRYFAKFDFVHDDPRFAVLENQIDHGR